MKTKFLYCIWFAGLLCMANPLMRAQTTITSGSHVIVATGTTMTNLKEFRIRNGGNLTINGTLNLYAGLSNKNTTDDDLGPGTVEFPYSNTQTISGPNTIQNLFMNNQKGLIVGTDTRVNGIFTLADGIVHLSGHLMLGPSATISGTPSVWNMVVPGGDGELRKEFTGPGTFTYPVGDYDGMEEYSPVTLYFNSGAFPSGNYVGVRLVNEKYPGLTGYNLYRYWTLSNSGLTTFNCNATFQYTVDDINGIEATLSCTRVEPPPWTTFSPANTSLHQLTALGLTGFGVFTGLKSFIAPVNQVLQNITIPNGTTMCYDATQVLTVAGNGTTFLVKNGGSVTLVAGMKISMLPGVTVVPGGYLHAYISTNGVYCGTTMNPLVANPVEADETLSVKPLAKEQFIRIYPNPTPDIFTVECSGAGLTTPVHIDIFGMNGQFIASKVMSGETKQQFSLAGMPPGFYMIHARSESKSEIAKIIKY